MVPGVRKAEVAVPGAPTEACKGVPLTIIPPSDKHQPNAWVSGNG
jgi:hypothetical protein